MNKFTLALMTAAIVGLTACGDDGKNGRNGLDGQDGQNGQNGQDGQNGLNSLITQTALAVGDSNCPSGGTRIDSGLDSNANGELDSSEITATKYLCDPHTPDESVDLMANTRNNAWFQAAATRVSNPEAPVLTRGAAKNVILFVGDGMGISTVTAARILEGQLKGKLGEEHNLSFDLFPFSGLAKTYNTDAQTPDSAGTMTAMMSGVKTDAGVIGVSEAIERGDCGTVAGNELVTALELAEIAGKSTGILSTARITHATPAATYAKIVMKISAVWMSITGIFNSHLMLCLAIEKFGTEGQKRTWLPKLASGELRGGLALTEPDAGTDLQGLRMVAKRTNEGYVINGTKTWISNGIHGSVFATLVKTDPDAQPRHKGMSLIIADKREGFTVGRKLEKLGYKSIDSAELVFDNYKLPFEQLIGEEEGNGFYQATGGLELGRINVASRGVGIAEGALQLALNYATIRKTFGKPIAEHQAIQLKLGEMATRAQAARLLTLDAAEKFDLGQRVDLEAGMAKYFASEAALENSIEGMRIHGGYGYSKEYDIERLYRDAPLTCIGEGTNEMQRIIIARQLVKRMEM